MKQSEVQSTPERRAENLRLLRAFLNATQEDLTGLLNLGSQSYYSSVERGTQTLTAGEARRVEKDLGLPECWLERNNANSLFLSSAELDLILELRRSSVDATSSFVAAISAIRVPRD